MKLCAGVALLILTLLAADASAVLREPARPDVNRKFDARQEAGISILAALTVQESFERLRNAEYLMNPDLMHKAVYKAFSFRKQEGLSLAVTYLRAPLTEITGDRVSSRLRDFTVARRILETFPEDAALTIVPLYERGDVTMKGNIIQAAGSVAGGQEIRALLTRALDDRSVYGEENPDSVGFPLRICDLAYNQLVLRYGIRDVLRTISPGHSISDRDYQIAILRGMLS